MYCCLVVLFGYLFIMFMSLLGGVCLLMISLVGWLLRRFVVCCCLGFDLLTGFGWLNGVDDWWVRRQFLLVL